MSNTITENYIPKPTGRISGFWGHLHRLEDADYLRQATEAEYYESMAGAWDGETGAIVVDGVTCYVQP
jgi:hypothetical protein